PVRSLRGQARGAAEEEAHRHAGLIGLRPGGRALLSPPMRHHLYPLALVFVLSPLGCGGAEAPPAIPPLPPGPAAPAAEEPEPAEPVVDAETLKKQQAKAKLDADLAKLDADIAK